MPSVGPAPVGTGQDRSSRTGHAVHSGTRDVRGPDGVTTRSCTMASGFHNLWASISSWWQGIDPRGILLFIGEKLFEGLLQAIAVVVIGWLVVYRQWRQLT